MLKGVSSALKGVLLSGKGMGFMIGGIRFKVNEGKETPSWEDFRLLAGDYTIVESITC